MKKDVPIKKACISKVTLTILCWYIQIWGKHKGHGPVNTNWGPGAINTNWGPGPININWGTGPVNTNCGPGPVNTNYEPGPGPRTRARVGGRETQTLS